MEWYKKGRATQFLQYLMCGATGVMVDYAVYLIALSAKTPYQFANAFGYVAGTAISFALNRRFTFAILDRPAQRIVLFFCVAVAGYTTSAFLLWQFVERAGIHAAWAKALTLPAIALLQFALNRSVTFRRDLRN